MTPISEMTNKKKKCYKCNGTGIASEIRVDGTQTCPVCDGTGVQMTDYSKLTNDELDRMIFKKHGWVELQHPAYPKWQKPTKNGTELWYVDVPHYSTDPRYAMELLEELCANEQYIEIEHITFSGNGYRIAGAESGEPCETVKRAIAEYWLQWEDAK